MRIYGGPSPFLIKHFDKMLDFFLSFDWIKKKPKLIIIIVMIEGFSSNKSILVFTFILHSMNWKYFKSHLIIMLLGIWDQISNIQGLIENNILLDWLMRSILLLYKFIFVHILFLRWDFWLFFKKQIHFFHFNNPFLLLVRYCKLMWKLSFFLEIVMIIFN